jgi:DNA adenine methylase
MSYYGGKSRMSSFIASLLPAHDHYVEPYGGALSVLLAKPPSRMETVNDLDSLLMTFWRVLRNKPEELQRICALTPHSRQEYLDARGVDLEDLDEVEIARLVWIMITQGRSGTLRKTGWRTYINPAGSSKSMPGYLDAYVDRMAPAAERLQRVSLECRPALEIIDQYGQHPNVCLYVDPPYLGSTRSDSGNGYRLDMRSSAQHIDLLDALARCRASVVLSGYGSDVYDGMLAGWDRIECSTKTSQGTGVSSLRTEVIWSNRLITSQGEFEFLDEGA